MKENELKGLVYKKIDDLHRKLSLLDVKVSGDYKSKLPSVKTTTQNSCYNPKENTTYINPNDKKLEDAIAEESMHLARRLRRKVKIKSELFLSVF